MNAPTSPTVLCGTDFSEHATQASTIAAALALKRQQPLVLLHAADEFAAHVDTPETLARLRGQARERLETEAARLASGGAEVRAELREGRLAEDVIVEFAEQDAVGLVVVAAVSKTAFDRWTLGSVSERVAEAAPAATLVVREAASLEAWLRGDRPLKVFVAADFTENTVAALRWVAEFRKIGPCEITAGYVSWPLEESHRLGVSGPMSFDHNLPEVQYILERDLQEKVDAILGERGARVAVAASWGRVDVQIIEQAREGAADLIVVGTHQRRGLERWRHGSISRGVLRHAPMNVACVPISAAPPSASGIRFCRRVLVAVDLTEQGGLAIPQAYGVVAEGGTVVLVHVAPRSQQAEVAELSASLRHRIPTGALQRGITTEVEVITDPDPVASICQAAEAGNADLVCIGAYARPGAVARAMGSVATRVVQQCRRPVLVVWPPQS